MTLKIVETIIENEIEEIKDFSQKMLQKIAAEVKESEK